MDEREWVQRESERQAAVEEAAIALGVSHEYSIDLRYTTRVETSEEITASSLEAVEKYCMELKHNIEDLEGDEIAYVRIDGDYDGDPEEIDCRDFGEPFSWDACAFVKQIAKAEPGDLAEWVVKARDLLKK